MREKRANKDEDKIKWGKLISFLVAIILLCIAIVISMAQEDTVGEVDYNNMRNNAQTEQAGSELSKTVNQVKEQSENLIDGGDNEEEDDDEINDISKTFDTNASSVENSLQENVDSAENDANASENVLIEVNDNISSEENATLEKNNVENEDITNAEFIFPVEGEVIKEFAKDSLIYSETLEEWITHTGIDIKADRATVVKSVADGTVKSIKNDPRYGLTVTIEHSNGFVSSYSSLLTAEFVKEGEVVKQGQTIGTVGNSAVFEVSEDSHLHFELIKDGSNINPEIYLK